MGKEEKDKPSTEDLQKQLDAEREKNAKNLVKLHMQRGVVSDGEVQSLEKLALLDYNEVETILEARAPAKSEDKESKEEKGEEGKKLAEEVKKFTQSSEQAKSGTSERDAWTFYDYFKKDPEALELMQKNDPEKYKKLEADFAKKANAMGLKTGE